MSCKVMTDQIAFPDRITKAKAVRAPSPRRIRSQGWALCPRRAIGSRCPRSPTVTIRSQLQMTAWI